MKFDYSKTYYKVTTKTENHHGFQYKDGVNVLKQKFNSNPKASCVRGGFYFTDKKNILHFLGYGYWVREILIPTNAQVILCPDKNKWRTDKIILEKKYIIPKFLDYYFDHLFDKKSFDYKNNSRELAVYCSNYFNKWFDKKRFNYKKCSWELIVYCSENFNKWFDKKSFDYENNSRRLAIHCSRNFDKWFDKKRFNYTDGSDVLIKHCSKYYKKWSQ